MPKTVLVVEKMKSLIEPPISRTEREDEVIKPYRSTVKILRAPTQGRSILYPASGHMLLTDFCSIAAEVTTQ